MACMLLREMRWEEAASPHKGMTQLIVPGLRSYKLKLYSTLGMMQSVVNKCYIK